jgi:lytic murein transglycosylase
MLHSPRPQLSMLRLIALAGGLVALSAGQAHAQKCGNDGAGFQAWIGQYRATAAKDGISAKALVVLDGLTYDSTVIARDRSQKSFKLSFEEFYARRVGASLLNRGKRLMQTHAATFARVEKQFGVPPAIITAIWGLETNYGADGGGKFYIPRSIATLAYDCRRSDFFKNELTSALKIVDRGDMQARELVGGWAGEIGQVQFLPSSYYKYAVDFDGDGRRDLVRSVPDMLASTANFLKGYGWQQGQPWGPGTANYAVIKAWNKAEVYQRTIAQMADSLAR